MPHISTPLPEKYTLTYLTLKSGGGKGNTFFEMVIISRKFGLYLFLPIYY